MIPPHTLSHVLPPFINNDPRNRANISPYDTDLCEVIDRFGTGSARVEILRGLLEFRTALLGVGIVSGYQWISGSFTEGIETLESRPPGDVDIVTVAHRPAHAKDDSSWWKFFSENQDLFDPVANKTRFHCDTYYIDLQNLPEYLVLDVSYWYGLFSHRRGGLWKGMLRIPLQGDDVAAQIRLAGVV